MQTFLWVGLAGAAGTWARWGVALGTGRIFGTTFPHGTLVVNLAGSFLLPALMQVALATSLVPPPWRVVLATGFLGGFTTYSSFNYETLQLLEERAWGAAAANVAATVGGCLLAGVAGLLVARRLVAW